MAEGLSEAVGPGTQRCAGAVSPHPPLPGRGRAAAHAGPAAWAVPPHRTPLGPALSHGWSRRAGASTTRRQRHAPGAPPPLAQLVEALALQQPAPSVATIHRKVAALATTRGLHVPSYDVVHDIVRQLDPALVTLAHAGSKVYSDIFDLLYRREAEAPNAIWQADHTLLDILLTDEKGHARKPWLTVILDDYSRAVAGYMVAFEAPSALHTALALRQAIWRKSEPTWQVCGIPGILYTDHGSDFTSQHLEQVCADLKIQAIFSRSASHVVVGALNASSTP